MTREEVISRLNKFAENAYGAWHDGDADIEAIDVAIKILKAEPIVYCRDCKYFEPNHEDEYKPCNGIEWCTNWGGGTTAGGYCHEAERKEP